MAAEKFGERLERLLRLANQTQAALGATAGVSQGHISNLVRGRAEPTREIAERLSVALGWNLSALVAGTEFAHLDTAVDVVVAARSPATRRLTYFASALTGLDESARAKMFAHADLVRDVCDELSVFLYRPADYTDPVKNADVPAERVYAIDRAQIARSDIVILHAGRPSFGAGQELEIAMNAGIAIALLVPVGVTVSRMVRGSYARIELVEFSTDDELRACLRRALGVLLDDLAFLVRVDPAALGRRVHELRERQRLSLETVAKCVGLSAAALQRLEDGEESIENPSILTLRRLADTFRTSVSYLVDELQARPEEVDDTLKRSPPVSG